MTPHDPAAVAAAREHREVPRFAFAHYPLLIATPRNREPCIVGVLDISLKGAGLVCDRPIDPGTVLTLKWPYGPWQDWRLVPARIVWVSPVPSGRYFMGCAFADRLPQADLDTFLRYGGESAAPGDAGRG